MTTYSEINRLDERTLILLAQDGCRRSSDVLMRRNSKFAVKFARKWTPRSEYPNTDELLSSCYLGMLRAIPKFDVSRGTRFITIAAYYMRSEMSGLLCKSRSVVYSDAPPFSKNLYYQFVKAYRKACAAMGSDIDLLHSEISKSLNVTQKTAEIYVNRFVHMNEDVNNDAIYDTPTEDTRNPLVESTIIDLMSSLNDREVLILNRRFVDDNQSSRQEIGAELGISSERVRQLEVNALSKLRLLIGEN